MYHVSFYLEYCLTELTKILTARKKFQSETDSNQDQSVLSTHFEKKKEKKNY